MSPREIAALIYLTDLVAPLKSLPNNATVLKTRGAMTKKLTWEQMVSAYPDEWLLITDYDLDNSRHLLAGVVRRHSKDKDKVYRLPSLRGPSAFRYTGESTDRVGPYEIRNLV